MKLSIITPYYKTLEYTKRLREVLEPQLTSEVEWIIVDDGCNEKELDKFKAKVVHLPENSGGASKPRNIGLDNAAGEYIAFIDSDDLVSEDYIQRILHKLGVDLIYLSWKGNSMIVPIIDKPPKWNCAVWCRVYRREIIGNIRFDETLRVAEDWKFNEQIKPTTTKSIKEYVYFYNSGRKGSIMTGE